MRRNGASGGRAAVDGCIVKLVVIDDDRQHLELVQAALADQGLEIHAVDDPQRGLELVKRLRPQVVLLDLTMPGVHGMDLLEQMVEIDPGTDVILMTGHYSTQSAVEAIQKGACDYLEKPLQIEKLRQRLGQLTEDAKRRQHGMKLEKNLAENFEFEGMIGRSPLILELFAMIRRIAPHFRTVLVTGPTGGGKDLVARALHRNSPAQKGPFVAVNCSSITETLAESELFGYVKGAFTGALQDKVGVFEFANGGTVLLDEIGDMPLTLQAKLLRVLENHEIQRVGSPVTRQVDARIIAATNRNLRELIRQGSFREDLYFRLSMVELAVPSLAQRPEDLLLLERHFFQSFATQYGKRFTGLTRRAQALLARYDWPGNVRELENVIGHACMMTESDALDIRDLPARLREQGTAAAVDDGLSSLEQIERTHTQRILERVAGNKVRAAEILGISRTQLYRIMRGTVTELVPASRGADSKGAAAPAGLKHQRES